MKDNRTRLSKSLRMEVISYVRSLGVEYRAAYSERNRIKFYSVPLIWQDAATMMKHAHSIHDKFGCQIKFTKSNWQGVDSFAVLFPQY